MENDMRSEMSLKEIALEKIPCDSQMQKQYEIEKEIYDIAVYLKKIRKEKN